MYVRWCMAFIPPLQRCMCYSTVGQGGVQVYIYIYTCAFMVRPTGAQVETMVTRYTLLGIEIHDELQMCKITNCRVQALYKYIYIVVETQLLWFCFCSITL